MREEMTHRERIMAAINHQPTDRVPLDYWGVYEITQKLMKHFNIKDNDGVALFKAMDIDKIMGIYAPHKPGMENPFKLTTKEVPLPDGSGVYHELVSPPLAKYETVGEIEANFNWPKPEDVYDYSGVRAQCERYHAEGFAVNAGYISLTYFYDQLRGIEQMLFDFAAEPEIAEYILENLNTFHHAHTKNLLDLCDGMADISECTDDFGSQTGLLMSEEMVERYVGKYFRKNIDLIKSYGAKVFHHDDGAIASLIPWIIEKGCEVLNPIQWHLPGWDLKEVKQKYGKQLCFHGGIDNQDVLPFRGVKEVQAEVEACVEALYMPDRTGYILAPCHNCQAITPVENILAMYDHARKITS